MQIRITIAAVLVLLCTSVSAQFMTVELAHEVPLNEFVIPVTQNGTLNFRECSDCKSFSARLTPNTQYIINGNQVELSEFRKQVTAARSRSNRSVTVVQHLETNTVTSIETTI
jgi:hypothetical protein